MASSETGDQEIIANKIRPGKILLRRRISMDNKVKKHPGVKLRVEHGISRKVLVAPLTWILGIGMSVSQLEADALTMIKLRLKPIKAIAGSESFALLPTRVTLAGLEDLPLIFRKRDLET